MQSHPHRHAASVVLPCLLFGLLTGPQTAHAHQSTHVSTVNRITADAQIAEVTLDMHMKPAIVIRFPVPAGGERYRYEGDLENRYNEILVANQDLRRCIQPGDVAVFADTTPPRTSLPGQAWEPGYAIYIMGRRLVRVDAAMAASSGTPSPRNLSIRWAKELQQYLPQLCWRPPNQPEPAIARNPPLIITTDQNKVGGSVGVVRIWGQPVFTLRGVQSDGRTALDRGDYLTRHLARLVVGYSPDSPDAWAIRVTPDATPGSASIWMGSALVATVTAGDAQVNGARSGEALAKTWAAALRRALRPAPSVPGIPGTG